MLTGAIEESTEVPVSKAVEDVLPWLRSTWNPRWFPIFEMIGNSGYGEIVLDEEQQESSPVLDLYFDTLLDEITILYPTLTNLMLAEAECYEANLYSTKYQLTDPNIDPDVLRLANSRITKVIYEMRRYIHRKDEARS